MNTEKNVIRMKTKKQFSATRSEHARYNFYNKIAERLVRNDIPSEFSDITLFNRKYPIYRFGKKWVLLIEHIHEESYLLVLDNIEANDIRCRLLWVVPHRVVTIKSKYARYTLCTDNVEKTCEELIRERYTLD